MMPHATLLEPRHPGPTSVSRGDAVIVDEEQRLKATAALSRGRPKVLTSTLRAYRQVRTCTILRLCSGASLIASDFARDFAGLSGTSRALFRGRVNRPSRGGPQSPS